MKSRLIGLAVMVVATAVIGLSVIVGMPILKSPAHGPDLTIRNIEVHPVEPQAGEFFTFTVYIANIGDAPSGEYDVKEYIRDTGSPQDYRLVGSVRAPSVAADQTIPWEHEHAPIYKPGRYQVRFEIEPNGFEDANLKNNEYYWEFIVIPSK